jgi:phosphoribosylaminoimidazole-succinocarboxamide synthase
MAQNIVLETGLSDYPLEWRGKVRDVYGVDGDLLIVTTDRVSAFDVILPNGIPDKGKVLNQLSLYWFEKSKSLIGNHVITGNLAEFPGNLATRKDRLELRSMLVKKLSPVPFECVVRGYLYGSGFKEYLAEGSVCGIPLPKGMKQAEKFPEPLFTPSTKATSGHDINVSLAVMADALGEDLTRRLEEISLRLYEMGREEAESKGIIIADTKFEFGQDPGTGEVLLIDEVLTPDSSRFWPASNYAPGRDQPSFDKQFVREYLETLDWDKTAPGPELPAEVVAGTRERFLQAYRAFTGQDDL